MVASALGRALRLSEGQRKTSSRDWLARLAATPPVVLTCFALMYLARPEYVTFWSIAPGTETPVTGSTRRSQAIQLETLLTGSPAARPTEQPSESGLSAFFEPLPGI